MINDRIVLRAPEREKTQTCSSYCIVLGSRLSSLDQVIANERMQGGSNCNDDQAEVAAIIKSGHPETMAVQQVQRDPEWVFGLLWRVSLGKESDGYVRMLSR